MVFFLALHVWVFPMYLTMDLSWGQGMPDLGCETEPVQYAG